MGDKGRIMAHDDSNYEAIRAAMAEKLENAGRLMGHHEVASASNGFPPETYSAINPESYRAAIVSGDIAMEETCFSRLGSELHDIHGAPEPLNARQTFSASASADTSNDAKPDLQQDMGGQQIKNPFELTMDLTPSTGGSSS